MVNRPKPCLSLPFKPPCQYSRPQNKIYSSQISFYTYHTNESDLSNQRPKSLDTTRLGAIISKPKKYHLSYLVDNVSSDIPSFLFTIVYSVRLWW